MKKITTLVCYFLIATTTVLAHDDGHKSPDKLPPFGPHGGKYTKLTKHFGEVVIKGNQITIYILERDIKNVAEDATQVSVTVEIPKKSKKKIKLVQNKKTLGYKGTVKLPKLARRVYFHIRCKLDGNWEKGRLLYEPNR